MTDQTAPIITTDGSIAEKAAVPGIVDALSAVKAAMVDGLTPERVIEFAKTANRKPKGRKAPELPEFTFPGSGYTVKVRKIGPWTLDQIRLGLRKIRQEPLVPVLDVEDGEYPDGRTRYRKEANPADPDYKLAQAAYEEWLSQAAGYRLLDVIVSSCCVVSPDDLDIKEIAAQRRALIMAGPQNDGTPEGEAMANQHRKNIEAIPDEEIFIRCLCLESGQDVRALQEFVTSQSMPTASEVAEQIDSFQPEV